MRERDLIVIPVTNVQAKFSVALPFLLEKTPTPYIGCSYIVLILLLMTATNFLFSAPSGLYSHSSWESFGN